MSTITSLAGGLAGAVGCDFRQAQNQLLFVEFAGRLSRLNLYRSGVVISSGTGILKGTWPADLDAVDPFAVSQPFATVDIQWRQHTDVVRSMDAYNTATIASLGIVDFDAITPDTLASLAYAKTPIVGNFDATNRLVPNTVFAVRTTNGNLAKVKVVTYGYDMKIQWVTYKLDSPYLVLGTGYSAPEDVQASIDGAHAYVTERSGDLVRVALANANRSNATVMASGMTAPQQMYLDEPRAMAYVVEFAPKGSLWRVDLKTQVKTAVLSGLENAVGVILTADLQHAYVSEQTTGPEGGRISRFALATGTRETIASKLVAPFFLQWLDPEETTLLVAERDPANRLTAVNVVAKTSNVAATGLPALPSSVAATVPGQMLVCCNDVIVQCDLSPSVLQPGGPLLMGIGFIPIDRIVGGLANTSVDPSYFFQVTNVPFGGTLPLLVNHMRAYSEGARYYRVRVGGVVHSDNWTDYKWNGFSYVARLNTTQSVGGQSGYYVVRPTSELFLWLNPALGDLLDTTGLTNTIQTIKVEFVNDVGASVAEESADIRIENRACTATITPPVLNGAGATPGCGLLRYAAKNADPVTMAFTANQPGGFASFSFSLIKGTSGVALPAAPPTRGPVPAGAAPITATVADLLGTCDTAGFAESVYVTASANNGWSRQSQYDASTAIAFVLAP
jgi:hypothetical protein